MSRRALLGLSLLLFACQSGAVIGATCTRASDCESPLVCGFGRCRTECAAARDCPAGQVCLVDGAGLGACELPAIDVCSVSCDPPLRCASGHCRVECASDGECPPGHVCTANACERAEVAMDAGARDGATPDASAPDAGHDGATSDHGDAGILCDPVAETGCASGQRCSIGGGAPTCIADTGTLALGDACSADVECGRGLSCQGGTCVRMCFVGDGAFCGDDLTCSYDSVHGQEFIRSMYGIGFCTQACDMLTDTGCPNGGTCALGTDSTGRDFTWCRDVGTVSGPTATCGSQYDCVASTFCYGSGAAARCDPFCDPTMAAATCPGGTCDLITRFTSRPQVGACTP